MAETKPSVAKCKSHTGWTGAILGDILVLQKHMVRVSGKTYTWWSIPYSRKKGAHGVVRMVFLIVGWEGMGSFSGRKVY